MKNGRLMILWLVLAAFIGCGKNDYKTHTVVIRQMKFNPSELTVNLHDTIVFVNNDIVTHDVTEASMKKWTSSPLIPSMSWKLVAKESAAFYCTIHPTMRGKFAIR